MKYPKTQTIFKRDENGIIIPTEYTLEEFKYLENCLFECTEKIDGTNTRIELISTPDGIGMNFKGKSDSSNVPKKLLMRLAQLFSREKLMGVFNFNDDKPCDITLYGEGYGAGIQKGGNYISNGVDFRLFAIKIDKWWLERKDIEELADEIGISVVPLIGYMTIPEAIEFVKKGFKSNIAENKDYNAEGLVLTTPNGLLFRNGERIITKIKTVDFIKYENYNK